MNIRTGKISFIIIADLFAVMFVFYMLFSLGMMPMIFGATNTCKIATQEILRNAELYADNENPGVLVKEGSDTGNYLHASTEVVLVIKDLIFERGSHSYQDIVSTNAKLAWEMLCRDLPRLLAKSNSPVVRSTVKGSASPEYCSKNPPVDTDDFAGRRSLGKKSVNAMLKSIKEQNNSHEIVMNSSYDQPGANPVQIGELDLLLGRRMVYGANYDLASKRTDGLMAICKIHSYSQGKNLALNKREFSEIFFRSLVEPTIPDRDYYNYCKDTHTVDETLRRTVLVIEAKDCINRSDG